jgi:hypothetical protein
MYLLQSVGIECPYCAEPIEIVVDASVEQQQYVEDCPVCCKPIYLTVNVSKIGDVQVQAVNEDEC